MFFSFNSNLCWCVSRWYGKLTISLCGSNSYQYKGLQLASPTNFVVNCNFFQAYFFARCGGDKCIFLQRQNLANMSLLDKRYSDSMTFTSCKGTSNNLLWLCLNYTTCYGPWEYWNAV